MAEVDNDNLLDYEGLTAYDEQIKDYIDDKIVFAGNVPAGGTTGQVLKKKSNTDYDVEWGEGGGSVDSENLADKIAKKSLKPIRNVGTCIQTRSNSMIIKNGPKWFDGRDVWVFDNDVMFTANSSTYKLIFTSDTAVSCERYRWDGSCNPNSGENIYKSVNGKYYSLYSFNMYVLDKENNTWISCTERGDYTPASGTYGYNVWNDGEFDYYSTSSATYKITYSGENDKEVTFTSVDLGMNVSGLYIIKKFNISNEKIYALYYKKAYSFDKTQKIWTEITLSGDVPISVYGYYVWKNSSYYYSNGEDDKRYRVSFYSNGITFTEVNINAQDTGCYFDGRDIWYKANEDTYKLSYFASVKGFMYFSSAVGFWNTLSVSGDLEFKITNGNFWSDGYSIIYSNHFHHYRFNVAEKSFVKISYSGLKFFYGKDVWSDGEDIYCSALGKNYKLTGATTWTEIDMGISIGISGENVWVYNGNIYFTSGGTTRRFDKPNNTWLIVTWGGTLRPTLGSNIWTDGENIYYCYKTSTTSVQLKLDVDTNTWEEVELYSQGILGSKIWTDGEDIYLDDDSVHLIFDKTNQQFIERDISMYGTHPNASNIFTDGEYIYSVNSNGIYVVITSNSKYKGFAE